MTLSLELTATRQARLLHEFRAAIAATSMHDLQSWGGRTTNILGQVTVRRGKNFGSLVSWVWDFLTDETQALLDALRRDEILTHVQGRATKTAERARALGRDFAALYDAFVLNLKNRPGDTAPKVVAGVLGFLVGSGGVDGDGGVPDLDFLGGIGAHRSIFTHSVITGIIVETLVLSILDLSRTIYRNVPEEHDGLWEDLNAASDDVFAALTTGLSAGIAYHLGVDATVDGDGTFKDLPVPLPQGGHGVILAGSAFVEGSDAMKRASMKTVDEVEGRVFRTFREAAHFARQDTAWVVVRASEANGFRVTRKARKTAKPPQTRSR